MRSREYIWIKYKMPLWEYRVLRKTFSKLTLKETFKIDN